MMYRFDLVWFVECGGLDGFGVWVSGNGGGEEV